METKILKITKNIVIGFFTLVFILGFFSKSVVNLFLPKVQVVTPIKSTFSRTLNVEGEIIPKETIDVKLCGSVIVEEYYVNMGDEVKKGDPLFRINKYYGVKSNCKSIEELRLSIEKEELKLKRLQDTSYEIDEMNISLMEEKVKNLKEEVEKLKKLYKAGSITASTLKDEEQSLKEAQIELNIQKLLLDEKRKENSIAIKETLDNIEKLNKEMNEIEKMEKLYSNVESDGIYYSEEDGIVLNINKTKVVLQQDTILIKIGIVKEFDSVNFVTNIPQEYYSFVNSAGVIRLENNDMPTEVKITKISRVANNNIIEIEGEFRDSIDQNPIIGYKLKGVVEKKYTQEKVIPKAAVIPADKYEVGAKGYVYVVEEEEGVLGTEYIARKVIITMTGIGDDKVSIDGMNIYDEPKIITNLSYKIKDGVRVLIWE